MEYVEPKLKHAPYYRCEAGQDWVPVCRKCETCVLAWKFFSTKEWFLRVSEKSQTRFLVSILGQLNNLHLLQYFKHILQTTQGKDFIYHRSRIDLSRQDRRVVKFFLNQMLDKTVERKMKEILYWFANSSYRTKANYTLWLLQMCKPKLLFTAANVVEVLTMRESSHMSGLPRNAADALFFPEKNYNTTSEPSNVYRAAKPKILSFPLSRESKDKDGAETVEGHATHTEEQGKSSLQCISEMKKMFSGKAGISRLEKDPCNLLMRLEDVQALSSGFSKYRDFIRYLPLHLSKYILRMLDKNSLSKCVFVSRHWAALVQQVRMDLSMQSLLQNQISSVQGSYTKGVDPNYACKISVPVPKIVEDGKRTRSKSQKWKLRAKSDYNLWTAYQNQETQQVQMEERNVYCGTYNICILSDTWDQNRIIHYAGGDLVAVSLNRKIHLLDISQCKETPIEFQGHAGSIKALFLCEEENILLSGSFDLSIRCWDLKSGACLRMLYGHQGAVTCIDLYKNRLASGAKDGQVKEWDIDTGKCLKTFKHKDPVLAIRISDTYIVSSCERGLVKVWHVVTGQMVKTLMGHEGAVKCLFFDQWHLVSGGDDGLVMAWSMVGKYERCLMAFKHPKEVLQVSLLYLRVISACGDGKIRIYNFLNGNCLKVIRVDARGNPVLSFFYRGNRMVVNTESNIIMFQFENVKWQYSTDKSKAKKTKDKEEEKEEAMLTEATENQGKPRSYQKDGKMTPGPIYGEVKGMDAGQEDLEAKLEAAADGVETPKRVIHHPKRKSWRVPISPDQFLLTVNALQQAHRSEEFAYPHRPPTQVVDAWGPSISYPRKVLTFKGKSIQHAVDQLRLSNPLMGVKKTSIPLEIHKLQPNLRKSLHSPSVQSTIPQPMLIRSRFSGTVRGGDHLTSSIGGVLHSPGPLTSMQVIKPNRMLAPQAGPITPSLKKERYPFYTTLDPLRMNTEFMLLTVKEEKEYGQAKMRAYQANESTRATDPGRASKAAWIRKIKGLPIDNFMKQGKIAAPELGQNVFI
uniref:CMT1A duplicated region transcript 1 protein n=1 Tax=Jaculus jaculus TaxID=51337 RepID=UPI001E1AFB37|nr:CMT1A duplicated region transcript 1 protein [Jaculus jaculus]